MCVDWEARQKIQLSSQAPSIICTPSKLMAAGYDGDEFFTRETTVIFQSSPHSRHHSVFSSEKERHRTVLDVELVSFQDRKSWFVFEVELDGEPSSQCWDKITVDSLSTRTWFLGDGKGGWRSQPDCKTARSTGAWLQQSLLCFWPNFWKSNNCCDQTGYQPL